MEQKKEDILLPRHEWWRRDYRARRYMQHFSNEELQERFLDVFPNTFSIEPSGTYSLKPCLESKFDWMESYTHLLEEYGMRGGFLPPDRSVLKKHVPDQDLLLLKRMQAKFDELAPKKPYFLKFGKCLHLRQSLERGEFRVAPASSYADPSLNVAIRDDELSRTAQLFGAKIKVERSGKVLDLVEPLSATSRSKTNYYVSCFSVDFGLRMFGDFGADACLVVFDPVTFGKRFIDALKAALPNWQILPVEVEYVDPLNPSPNWGDVFSTKHFRYTYQAEMRFVVLPPQPAIVLNPIFVTLGDLRDCCALLD